MSTRTFAVVHGAGDVGSSWDLVAAELRGLGHDVVAVDLPCEDDSAGFGQYADTMVAAIGDRDDVVVVAHSLGGFTGPLVADRVAARQSVFVAAMVPRPGESAGEWWSATGHASDPLGDTDHELFCQDLAPEVGATAMAAARGQSATPMGEPWPLECLPAIDTRYLLFRQDRMMPAGFTRTMALDRLGFEPDEMDGSHMAYVSRPAELAARLDGYAQGAAR